MTKVIERELDRRTFLKWAGAGGLAVAAGPLLAACGGGSSSTTTGQVGGALNLFTWEGYDMQSVFAPWRKQNGIEQKSLGFINTQNDVIAKLASPVGGKVDVTSVNTSIAAYAHEQGLIQGITTDEVPELKQLYPFFRDSPLFKADNGEYFCVPWTWGFTSITYLADVVPEPQSYQEILDPKYAGRIGTIDDPYNNVVLACIATGVDPDTLTKSQLDGPVLDFLKQVVANSKTLSTSIGDQVNLLAAEEVDYMLVGLDLIDVLTKEKGVTTKTAVPKEGVAGFTDCNAISARAPDKENAIAFVRQFITPGKAAGAAQTSIYGATTNPKIVPYIEGSVRALYPYDELESFLEKVVMPAGWPHESDGELATFEDTVNAWEEAKASA